MVEDDIRFPFQAAMPQVHQKEGKVVKHVDCREPIVEFDRIEKPGLSLPTHDILEMQVAMTAADEPFALAFFDESEFRAEFQAETLNKGADS